MATTLQLRIRYNRLKEVLLVSGGTSMNNSLLQIINKVSSITRVMFTLMTLLNIILNVSDKASSRSLLQEILKNSCHNHLTIIIPKPYRLFYKHYYYNIRTVICQCWTLSKYVIKKSLLNSTKMIHKWCNHKHMVLPHTVSFNFLKLQIHHF